MTQTPEQRREALLDLMRQERFQTATPEHQLAMIEAHYQINEPAIADAIRYGVIIPMMCGNCHYQFNDGRDVSWCTECEVGMVDKAPTEYIYVNYPEGHEKR